MKQKPKRFATSRGSSRENEQFEKMLALVKGRTISPVNMPKSDGKLNESFQNPREVGRDEAVTDLLSSYVHTYKKRQDNNHNYRKYMFWVCLGATGLFALLIVFCVVYSLIFTERNVTDIVTLITACISSIGSIAFLLDIIAKYVFPSDEENHIATMVQAVQHNDLEERKLRYQYKSTHQDTDTTDVSDDTHTD